MGIEINRRVGRAGEKRRLKLERDTTVRKWGRTFLRQVKKKKKEKKSTRRRTQLIGLLAKDSGSIDKSPWKGLEDRGTE